MLSCCQRLLCLFSPHSAQYSLEWPLGNGLQLQQLCHPILSLSHWQTGQEETQESVVGFLVLLGFGVAPEIPHCPTNESSARYSSAIPPNPQQRRTHCLSRGNGWLLLCLLHVTHLQRVSQVSQGLGAAPWMHSWHWNPTPSPKSQ